MKWIKKKITVKKILLIHYIEEDAMDEVAMNKVAEELGEA